MRFADPIYLHGIWLIVVVWLAVRFLLGMQKRRWQKYFSKQNWTALTDQISFSKRRFKTFLFGLSFVFLCLALARPQLGSSLQTSKSVGVEMMIALDVSESMMAEDNKPSRLSFAKAEINRLLDRLGGDRVGLIAFAGNAFLVSPITTDKSAIRIFLDSLSPQSVSSQGTNVTAALKAAQEAFERGGTDSEDGISKATRAIVIASDGEDHEEGAIRKARELSDAGIKTYAWGFGTEKGVPIPQRDEFGNLRGYKKDHSGQVIVSTARDKFLRDLAASGGGEYVHAFFGGNAPEVLEKSLDKLQKAEFSSQSNVVYDEKFQIPLAISVILFLFALSVTDVLHGREGVA